MYLNECSTYERMFAFNIFILHLCKWTPKSDSRPAISGVTAISLGD